MRSAALVTVLAALGAWAGGALADVVPPVPVPTVTVPTVMAPTLPLPTAPAPTTSPVQTPTLSSDSATSAVATLSASTAATQTEGGSVSGTAAGSGGSAAGSSRPSEGGSSTSPTTSGSASASPRMSRLRASRPWLAQRGPESHRSAILSFRLAKSSRLVFRVMQVAPVCRLAGAFAVRGHAGLNRVRFRSRAHGRLLAPGTYSITARIRGGRTVLHVVLVIVPTGVPTPTELAIARHIDVCGAPLARGLSSLAQGLERFGVKSASISEIRRNENPSMSAATPATNGGGALGLEALSPTQVAKHLSSPLVIATLALAVVLLGLAAFPEAAIPDPRINALLARHRAGVALAGVAALAAAIVALGLG